MKAARLRGADVTDKGIECQDGEDVEGLEIELTDHPPEVSGTVSPADGEPVPGVAVVFFSQDAEQWRDSRRLALVRPDSDGHFVVHTLPPGRYYAATSSSAFLDTEWEDPATLDRLRREAIRFSLGDGESRTLQLVFKRAW